MWNRLIVNKPNINLTGYIASIRMLTTLYLNTDSDSLAWSEQTDKNFLHFSTSRFLIKHKGSTRWIKGVLLSRKSSWQAGALRLIKLKPRVGRQRPLLAADSPGVKPCNMLLLPAPSRPRTRTWRVPRSSSSCRQTMTNTAFRNTDWRQKNGTQIIHSTLTEDISSAVRVWRIAWGSPA